MALINQLGNKAKALLTPQTKSIMLDINLLQEHEENFFNMDSNELKNLKEDIEVNGLNTVLLVRKLEKSHRLFSEKQPFQILVGHRRFKCVRDLKWTHVEVKVVECSDVEAEKILITDNLTARKITLYDHLEAVKRLSELFKREKEQNKLPGRIRDMIAEEMDMDSSHIGRYERILKRGSEKLIDALRTEKISLASATELCKLDIDDQETFLQTADDINNYKSVQHFVAKLNEPVYIATGMNNDLFSSEEKEVGNVESEDYIHDISTIKKEPFIKPKEKMVDQIADAIVSIENNIDYLEEALVNVNFMFSAKISVIRQALKDIKEMREEIDEI